MRLMFLMLCLKLTISAATARSISEAPRPFEVRSVLAPNQFERNADQLRAAQPHTDHYLVLRLEIEALRRENPEHKEFLDRYLKSVLQSER